MLPDQGARKMITRYQLKELCDVFCQKPTTVNLNSLREAIENGSAIILQEMQRIILLPLVNQLDTNAG